MIKKELFFHEQTPTGRSLGFSAIFVPDKVGKDANGNSVVWMAITFCNKKDRFFNKKIARQVLRDRPLELVKVKDIPHKLAEAGRKACGDDPCYLYPSVYHSMWRHFL